MVLQHHECCDGSGYPNGLEGDQILIGSRIIAVADVAESMASARPYRTGLGLTAAVEELRRGAGTIHDSEVVAAFLRVIEKGRLTFDQKGTLESESIGSTFLASSKG